MNRWPNVLRGCAYGDSWGDKNEFKNIDQLTAENPMGPVLPANLRITDDTQMTLALAKALDGAADYTPNMLRARVIDEWIAWYFDEDNNRAPGRQCLTAIGAMARRDAYWMEATDHRNDGCGTVMRTSAAAFLPERLWAPVAAWQAVSTHGGANGVAACLLAAGTIRQAAAGQVAPGELTEAAYMLAECSLLATKNETNPLNLRDVGRWIAWAPAINSDDPKDHLTYLHNGLKVMRDKLGYCLDKLDRYQADPWALDPCAIGGDGWRAHTCLATALVAADSFPDRPISALRRATVTDGDSDSIAAVAGALLGAVHPNPWPDQWFMRLEPRYRTWIHQADKYNFGGELA